MKLVALMLVLVMAVGCVAIGPLSGEALKAGSGPLVKGAAYAGDAVLYGMAYRTLDHYLENAKDSANEQSENNSRSYSLDVSGSNNRIFINDGRVDESYDW